MGASACKPSDDNRNNNQELSEKDQKSIDKQNQLIEEQIEKDRVVEHKVAKLLLLGELVVFEMM